MGIFDEYLWGKYFKAMLTGPNYHSLRNWSTNLKVTCIGWISSQVPISWYSLICFYNLNGLNFSQSEVSLESREDNSVA